MSDTSSAAQQRSMWERHAQSFIAVLLLGVVSWVGVTVTNGLEATARLEERVTALTVRIDDMRGDLVSATQQLDAAQRAVNALGRVQDQISDHEARLRVLEKRAVPRPPSDGR